jgi:hypothetical protein
MIAFNPTTNIIADVIPRQAGVSTATEGDTKKNIAPTKQPALTEDHFSKTTVTTENSSPASPSETMVVETTVKPNGWWQGLTASAAGLIGSVLGAVGGYKVTELLQPPDVTATKDSTAIATPLELAKQQPLYYIPHAKSPVTTDKLPTNLISGYYEFTPHSVLNTAEQTPFTVQYHLPNQAGSITYTFQPTAIPNNLTGAADAPIPPQKPTLSTIDVQTPDGTTQQLRLNTEGQVVSKIEVRPNAEGIVQSHEWHYHQDGHKINTYYAIFNDLDTNALPQQETVYHQVLDAKTNALKEVTIIRSNGNGERIQFNPKTREATERFVAQTVQDASKFSTLKALILAETPLEETVETTSKNKLKQVAQTIGEGIGNFINRFNPGGFHTVDDINKPFSTAAEVQAANPAMALRESHLGALIPTQGDAILQSLQKSWRTYEANFNPSQAFNWEQLKQAFASTTTGQRIGLALGAVIGGSLGVLALLRPVASRQEEIVRTNTK